MPPIYITVIMLHTKAIRMTLSMKRRVLVTGGAGLIGRRVALKLVERGYDTYVYDSMQLGSIKEFRTLADRIHVIKGDIRDFSSLKKVLKRVDQVLHLSAPSSFLMYEERPIESTVTTYVGFLNLMEAMRKSNKKRLVFASTSAVYEGLETPWREDMNCSPPDLKALSKLHNEQIARQYAERHGIKSIALRPASVYGVGEYTKKGYANVISLFVWAMLNGERPIVWGNGSQDRDFIYVDDCAELATAALQFNWGRQTNDFEIFNVGTGISTSFNDIIRIINKRLGTNLDPVYVKVPIPIYATSVLTDVTKAKQLLHWEPNVAVEEGVGKIIENARRELRATALSKAQKYALHIKPREV